MSIRNTSIGALVKKSLTLYSLKTCRRAVEMWKLPSSRVSSLWNVMMSAPALAAFSSLSLSGTTSSIHAYTPVPFPRDGPSTSR